jgi:uncharacterized protein (DUF2062 family)
VRSPFSFLARTRVHRFMLDLWERAKREPSTPRQVGLSVGLGAFTACTPFIGLHFWISLGLATVFRLNRVWAAVGSRLSSTPILLLTTFSEIQVAHRLRTGTWVAMNWHHAFDHGRELVGDWIVGTVLVGGPLALTFGFVAYSLARRWQQRLIQRTPDALPRPSSESPR